MYRLCSEYLDPQVAMLGHSRFTFSDNTRLQPGCNPGGNRAVAVGVGGVHSLALRDCVTILFVELTATYSQSELTLITTLRCEICRMEHIQCRGTGRLADWPRGAVTCMSSRSVHWRYSNISVYPAHIQLPPAIERTQLCAQ